MRGSSRDPQSVLEDYERARSDIQRSEQAVLERLGEIALEHEDDVVSLIYEDKRVVKLRSCKLRCTNCAVVKCGVSVWRREHQNRYGNHTQPCRFLTPFDWFTDSADYLLSTLVFTIYKMKLTRFSMLFLSLPHGSYGNHSHFVTALALVMEQLPITQIRVFLTSPDRDSFHSTALSKRVHELSCTTVHELVIPDQPDWQNVVSAPFYEIVDRASCLATNPIDPPSSSFFVLQRNAAGAVMYCPEAGMPERLQKVQRVLLNERPKIRGRGNIAGAQMRATLSHEQQKMQVVTYFMTEPTSPGETKKRKTGEEDQENIAPPPRKQGRRSKADIIHQREADQLSVRNDDVNVEEIEKEEKKNEGRHMAIRVPANAVPVFKESVHSAEDRRCVLDRMMVSQGDLPYLFEQLFTKLEENGDGTPAVVSKWKLMQERLLTVNKTSLRVALRGLMRDDERIFTVTHPEIEPADLSALVRDREKRTIKEEDDDSFSDDGCP